MFVVILALLCGAVLGTLVGPLFGAVILRVAAKRAENLNITLGAAYITALSAFLLNVAIFVEIYIVNFAVLVLGFGAFGLSGKDNVTWLIILLSLLVVGFSVQAGTISILHKLSFPKGLKLAAFALFPSVMAFLVIVVFVTFIPHFVAEFVLIFPKTA